MEDINQNVRNTYVIRRKLAELRKFNGNSHFEYWVGEKFRVNIYTRDIQDLGHDDKDDRILNHSKVDVNVYDVKRGDDGLRFANFIYLEKDSRFKNYQPIQYKQYGISDGREMPINTLCELIKYLHIISKLTAFMWKKGNMLKEDKEKLKELMMNYPADVLMKELAETALEVAGDISDLHQGNAPPIVKRYTQLAVTLEDIMSGRPFLV